MKKQNKQSSIVFQVSIPYSRENQTYRCSATQLARRGFSEYPRGTIQSPCIVLYSLSCSRVSNHLISIFRGFVDSLGFLFFRGFVDAFGFLYSSFSFPCLVFLNGLSCVSSSGSRCISSRFRTTLRASRSL